jgi:hypothetical protein
VAVELDFHAFFLRRVDIRNVAVQTDKSVLVLIADEDGRRFLWVDDAWFVRFIYRQSRSGLGAFGFWGLAFLCGPLHRGN